MTEGDCVNETLHLLADEKMQLQKVSRRFYFFSAHFPVLLGRGMILKRRKFKWALVEFKDTGRQQKSGPYIL